MVKFVSQCYVNKISYYISKTEFRSNFAIMCREDLFSQAWSHIPVYVVCMQGIYVWPRGWMHATQNL